EGKLRGEYIEKVKRCLDYATRPDSPDFMNFTTHQQPLVDAAFLAHGLLRSKAQVWDKLEPRVQQQVIDCLKSTRAIRTPQNNWLLFSGILEAFLVEVGEGGDLMRIDFAVTKHLERYKGDGVYGDGEEFHWDYYNSFVIQPMLVDVLGILHKHQLTTEATYNSVVRRMTRYAAVLERSISPEGTFPPMGRSLCYRIGVFQALGQAALSHQLPVDLVPAQVRCAMTAVIRRMMDAPGTYNEQGWLTIGFVGAQPSMGENYVNTGSLYLCCAGFLPLGLPESDPFWSNPDQEWTSVKLWKGQDMKADHML
ncbi:MAG: DUF2264 domain-containing protein, partial [Alistipes sp.]|nr:DUF2264 domain-containing protein [Alistipes sp.]